jgi:hypothetical protein
MAALIDSVVTTETLGREGMLATSDPMHSMVVRFATATDLYFGRAAIRASTDRTVLHPSTVAGAFMGLVIEDQNISAVLQTTANTVPANYDARLMTAGTMWVVPEVAVTQGQPVYYRFTGAGAAPEALGRLRNDVDTDQAALIEGAEWMTSAGAGELAIVRLNVK